MCVQLYIWVPHASLKVAVALVTAENNSLAENAPLGNTVVKVCTVCLVVGGLSGVAKELMSEFADSLPGIDEAKSFMQVMV